MMLKKLIVPLAVAGFVGALPLAWVYGKDVGVRASKPVDSSHLRARPTTVPATFTSKKGKEVPAAMVLAPRVRIDSTPAWYIDEYGADSKSLLVKFKDDVRARVQGKRVLSQTGRAMREVQRLVVEYDLEPSPLISVVTTDGLEKLQQRVAERTGQPGPDLAGLMRFRGEVGQVRAAAHAMQALDVVEYVDFEEVYEPADMSWMRDAVQKPGDIPAVLRRVDASDRLSQRTVLAHNLLPESPVDEPAPGGVAGGGDLDFSCGGEDTEPCFWAHGTPSCDDALCCECVCEQHEICCDEDFGAWTEVCVYLAALSGCPCPGPPSPPWWDGVTLPPLPPPCPGNGGCDVANGDPGCDNYSCCVAVCNADPSCCDTEWTQACADQALETCSAFNPDFADPSLPTPDLRPAQGYLTANNYFVDALIADANGEPGRVSTVTGNPYLPDLVVSAIAPFFFSDSFTPFSGYWGQGYNLDQLWALGDELAAAPGTGLPPGGFGLGPDPGGGPPMISLSRGRSVKVAVLFPTAFVHQTNVANSEDPVDDVPHPFTHEALRERVTYALPDQQQLLLTNSTTGLLDGHVGTAVLGIIGGGTVPNANMFSGEGGMVGVSPESDLRFYPTSSVEQLPGDAGALGGVFLNSLAAAIADLDPGDVINIPFVPRPPNAQFTSFAIAFDLANLATVLGINVVVAAGDGCNGDGTAVEVLPQFDGGDSGAIIVGAVSPGMGVLPPNPLNFAGDIGSYHRGGHNVTASGGGVSFGTPGDFGPARSRFGDAIHVSGWGDSVGAPGFGTLYLGDPADPLSPWERSYTNRFGGTPAASAMVAGIAANLSGLTKQFYGFPLSPLQIRGEIASNGSGQPGLASGAPWQCFGSFISNDPLLVGSHNWPDPLTGENLPATVVFTNARSAAEWLLIGGTFDDCEELEQAFAIRGTHLSGTVPVLCSEDGLFFTVRSEGTSASSNPSFVPPGFAGPVSDLTYRTTGQVADVFTIGIIDDPSIINQYGIRMVAAGTTVPTIQTIELYDWAAGRWQWGATQFVPAGAPNDMGTLEFATFNPQRFFNADGVFLVRTWAYGFGAPPNPGGGFGTGTSDVFDFRLDLVEIGIVNVGDVPGDGD